MFSKARQQKHEDSTKLTGVERESWFAVATPPESSQKKMSGDNLIGFNPKQKKKLFILHFRDWNILNHSALLSMNLCNIIISNTSTQNNLQMSYLWKASS